MTIISASEAFEVDCIQGVIINDNRLLFLRGASSSDLFPEALLSRTVTNTIVK